MIENIDDAFGEEILRNLDGYFGAKKKYDFHKAFLKFEIEADRLIKEGKRSEIFLTREALDVKKFVDQLQF